MKRIIYMIALLILAAAAVFAFGCAEIAPAEKTRPVISEVVSSNLGCYRHAALGTPDWVELYNPGDKAIDLSGWSLLDESGALNAFVFPEGAVIAPRAYVALICADGTEPLPDDVYAAVFGISKNGETLTLKDGNGEVVKRLAVPALEGDISYALAPTGEYGFSSTPTFTAENTDIFTSLAEAAAAQAEDSDPQQYVHGALVITELQKGDLGWAELYNASDEPVELSDYYLTDSPDEPLKWRLPAHTLEPCAFAVCELDSGASGGEWSAGFKLGRSEGALMLFSADGALESELIFDPALPDVLSAVAAEGGAAYTAHVTKGAANSGDVFSELVWSEDEEGMAVVVNEVLPKNKYGIMDAEGDRSDWAELYNRSSAAVSLSGYYLTDDIEDPAKWALPDITLAPGEYLLIFLSGKDCELGELHAPFGLSDNDDGVFVCTYDGMRYNGIPLPDDMPQNVSVGRAEDGSLKFYAAPTPGAENTTYGFDSWEGLGGFDPNSLYISEVSGVSAPKNGSGDGIYINGASSVYSSDWIELYNGSDDDMDLAGWSITDDPDEPDKYPLDGVSVPAGGYMLIKTAKEVLTGKVREIDVAATGDTLILFDAEGAVRDVFDTGVTSVGVTSGRERLSSSGRRVFFKDATPGRANAAALSGYAAEPVFSNGGLYCAAPFSLELKCAAEGAVIRYTLDGSTPTSQSPVYKGAIHITGSCTVRARAYAEGMLPSFIVTHTYVFEAEHSMPVVCLSLSEADFDIMYTSEMSESGGITHGAEVACSMEYYIEGRQAFATGAGVRVSGASTSLYPQKSLGLYFRAGYGRSSLEFPLFEDCGVTEFRSLVLRNGGQDAYYSRMRDSFMSRICSGLDIEAAAFRPVVVYINGVYWGIYDLKENLNEDYLVSHYGSDRSSVEIIKRNSVALAGDKRDFMNLREYCRTADFSSDAEYARLCERLDADSIIDYLAARIYFFDADMFNQKYWHASDGTLKWRAVFFDSDYAMMGGDPSGSVLASYFDPNGVKSAHGSITNMDLYCALVQNGGWRDKFVLRYIYLAEYVFCPENALEIFDELAEEYAPEIARHYARWSGMMSSEAKWREQVQSFRSCIAQRQSYALGRLRSFFELSNSQYEEYLMRAEILHNGGEDPGGHSTPAPAPTPRPTPTPAPTEAPEPTAEPEQTPEP